MKKPILIPFVLFINIISAQVNIETILQENFKDNSNSWELFNDKDYSSEIKDNKLYFNNKTDSDKWAYLNTDINLKKDFIIETSVKKISGKDELLTLFFNKSDDDKNFNDFGISDDGYWKFKQLKNENYIEKTGWSKIDFIKTGEFNTLTIQKIDNKVFFLINNTPVLVKSNMDLSFKQVGLSICQHSEVVFKYLKIGYLKMSKSDKKQYAKDLYQKITALKKVEKNVIIENTPTKELYTSFNDNEFNFTLGKTKDYTFEIANSALEIVNTSKYDYQTWSDIKLNPSHDFDVSTSLKRVSGTVNKGISLLIKDKEDLIQFAYAHNGYWFSKVEKNEKVTNHSEWQKTSLIKENENNSLRIKKIENNVYFILNNKVVNKLIKEDFGNTIYIKVPDSIKVSVDDLKITQTYRSKKEQDKLIIKYDNLWNDAKKENIGALNKIEKPKVTINKSPERYSREKTKAEKRFIRKQDKKLKKYEEFFNNATRAEVIKKLGQPYKDYSSFMIYKWDDYYDGRKQELTFYFRQDSYKNVKFYRVDKIRVYIK
ncbi:hypothetical protein OD91_2491 [Lutibacter sp. Hel_I_33_5]|uniref:hypothetical protein n=1 Tax=Lutibacter sp. Hel_I_33_5 TaxID=1566289 RepID=UPI0011A7F302|nr:hypothetical protein [Lutibacter sp. Hel_I_33_5]TVZ57183.1 hypothetical protein OD91_2491 [Lutibacter sp. Hel_I_33_5]